MSNLSFHLLWTPCRSWPGILGLPSGNGYDAFTPTLGCLLLPNDNLPWTGQWGNVSPFSCTLITFSFTKCLIVANWLNCNIKKCKVWQQKPLIFHPQFVCLEGLVTSISDMYPSFFLIGHRRKLLLLLICVVSFFVGLMMVTEVRVHLFYLSN